MELTWADKLFIAENPELEEEYLKRRNAGEGAGIASILVSRQTPAVARKDERMRNAGKEYNGLSLPGEKFVPKSEADLKSRAAELRSRGYNVSEWNTKDQRDKLEEREAAKKRKSDPREMLEQLKKDGVV